MLLPCLHGCVDVGNEPRTRITGDLTVGGPGIVLFERGHVQLGTFERGAVIDANGHFEVDVPVGGPWGVHVYLDNYFYMPLEVQVAEGLDNPVEQPDIRWEIIRQGPAWGESGAQPLDMRSIAPIADTDLGDNPVVTDATVTEVAPGVWQLSMNAQDPNGDLSRQLLAMHAGTAIGLQLNAPAPPVEDNFPNGIYTATVYLPEDADPSAPWYFVAADHGCSNSPVIEVRP
jgi:hypothetical protein